MPKAERRQSGPTRSEPYPAIKPGDKPKGIQSKSAAPKALVEKPAKTINVISNPKESYELLKLGNECAPIPKPFAKGDEPSIKESEPKAQEKSTKKRASAKSDKEPSNKSKAENFLTEILSPEKPGNNTSSKKPATKPSPETASSEKPSSFLEVVLPTHLPSGDIPI